MQATRLRTLAPKVRGHIGGSTYELRIVPPLSPRLSAFRTSLAWLLHLALKAGAPEVQSNARQGSDCGNRGNRAGRRRECLGRPAAASYFRRPQSGRARRTRAQRSAGSRKRAPAVHRRSGMPPSDSRRPAAKPCRIRRSGPRVQASTLPSRNGVFVWFSSRSACSASGTRSGAPAGRAVDNPTGAVTHSPPEALP